jgi:hypothetical protein
MTLVPGTLGLPLPPVRGLAKRALPLATRVPTK